MSKMDGLRAMREARYAAAANRSKQATPATRAVPPVAPRERSAPTARAAATAASTSPEPEAATEELCGHRNMGGRTCTREAGHAAKSHRYS